MEKDNKYDNPFSHPRWHELLVPTIVKEPENNDSEQEKEIKVYYELIEKMSEKIKFVQDQEK